MFNLIIDIHIMVNSQLSNQGSTDQSNMTVLWAQVPTHVLYNFSQTNLKDFSRTNYNFQGLRFIQ